MSKSSKYRKMLASIEALEDIVEGDDEIVVDELEEQAPEELEVSDVEAEDDNKEAEDEVKAAEELLAELEADDENCETDDEIAVAEDILAPVADDEVELPDDKEIVDADDVKEVLDACDELEQKLGADEAVTASEAEPGIEDEIEDTANGGDPTLSELPDTQIDTATDAEVYPTESEYVARVTARLDKIASILERKGMKKMAFRVDKLSDELEASVR